MDGENVYLNIVETKKYISYCYSGQYKGTLSISHFPTPASKIKFNEAEEFYIGCGEDLKLCFK
jgi:hypothetical protein